MASTVVITSKEFVDKLIENLKASLYEMIEQDRAVQIKRTVNDLYGFPLGYRQSIVTETTRFLGNNSHTHTEKTEITSGIMDDIRRHGGQIDLSLPPPQRYSDRPPSGAIPHEEPHAESQ